MFYNASENYTNNNNSQEENGIYNGSVNDLFVFVFILICGITLVCNSVLIYIIARTKTLHTSTNIFILSLACSDLLTGACVMPVAIACRLQQQWLFPAMFCDVIGVLNSVGKGVTVLSMLSVSIDRYIAVSKPLKYSSIMGPVLTGVLLAWIWTQSILFSLFPLFGVGNYNFDNRQSICSLSLENSHEFFLTKYIICVLIPCFVICVTLMLIFKAAKSHHRIFTALPLPFTMPLSGAPSIVNYKRSTMRAMRALFIIVFCYSLLWTPFSVISILELRHFASVPAHWVTFSVLLGFGSSAVNPLIITALNKKFKEKFIEVLCLCKSCKKPRTNRIGHTGTHIDGHSNITGVPSTYATRAGCSHVTSQANEQPARELNKAFTRPILRLQPPTPKHMPKRPLP